MSVRNNHDRSPKTGHAIILVFRGQVRQVNLTTVSRLLGYKDLTMTLRYAHLAPSHNVKALDLPDNALNENFNYTKTIQSGVN